MPRLALRRLLKPLLGLGILALLLASIDLRQLGTALLQARPELFVLGLLASIAANALSVLRWQRIAAGLGATHGFWGLMRIYLQAIALNSFLPGGIVGGDIYRGVRLHRLAPQITLGRAAFSVLAERVSGLWGLGAASLLAIVLAQPSVLQSWYGLAVAALALGPAVGLGLLSLRRGPSGGFWGEAIGGLLGALPDRLRALVLALPQLLPTLPLSMLMQATTILAFGLCLQSVGVEVSWPSLAVLCTGVFLGAVLPASVGGFGAREASTLFFFGLAGAIGLGQLEGMAAMAANPEALLAGSILFGIAAVVQGLIGALLFALPTHHPQP